MVLCCCASPPEPRGACCQASGLCTEDTTQATCEMLLNGVWQGAGTNCNPNPCPIPTQACCYDDGSCEDTLSARCVARGGTPQGVGTNCAGTDCPQPTGACCEPDGTCTEKTEADCLTAGHEWQGAGTTCNPNPCPVQLGACCNTEDPWDCEDLSQAACVQKPNHIWTADRQCADVQCECSSIVGFGAHPDTIIANFSIPSSGIDYAAFGLSPSAMTDILNWLAGQIELALLGQAAGLCVYNIVRDFPDPLFRPADPGYSIQVEIDVEFWASPNPGNAWVEVQINLTNPAVNQFQIATEQQLYRSNEAGADLFAAWSLPGTIPPPGTATNFETQTTPAFLGVTVFNQGTINILAQ